MLDMLILLLFGKMQDHVYQENSRAWQWALAYAGCLLVTGLFGSGSLVGVLVGSVLMGLYAWLYFALLRWATDNLALWLLIFFGGAVLPLILLFQIAAKAGGAA